MAATSSTTRRRSSRPLRPPAAAPATPARSRAGAPDVRARHLASCSSDPRRVLPLRRARGRAPGRGDHRAGGQAPPPRARLLRPHALRLLDDLRIRHGRLDAPVAVGDDGGTLRVELNHTDPSSLPAGFRLGDNDTRILAVASNLANEGRDVTVVTKDLPMRVKASAVGLDAEEYRAELAVDSGWTGMAELDVAAEEIDELYDARPASSTSRRPRPALPHRAGAALRRGAAAWAGSAPTSRCAWCAATATRSACTAAAPSSGSPSTCCSTPTSASSRLGGRAGTGKSRAGAVRRPRGRDGAPPARARSWSSGRCTPSAARSSATCPAARPRR